MSQSHGGLKGDSSELLIGGGNDIFVHRGWVCGGECSRRVDHRNEREVLMLRQYLGLSQTFIE